MKITTDMKIGIFDSGLGGLIVAHSLIQKLPEYDTVYLGDTARVPYGNRSQQTIYEFTLEALNFLFHKDCALVILACNTASAEALHKVQQEFLPMHFPGRKVLGVLIPAAEVTADHTKNKKIGVLATVSTVESQAFPREIKKLLPEAEVFQEAAPLLVPLIENNGAQWARPILEAYLSPLMKKDIDTLILGCTHYPILKKEIRNIVGEDMALVSQDEIIPRKLETYLSRHPEIENQLSKKSGHEFFVTDITDGTKNLAQKLFGEDVGLELSSISQEI